MIVVRGTIQVAPADHDAMVAIAHEVEAPSRAEPGCLDYTFWIHPEQLGQFHVSELWQDEEALAEHVMTSHYRQFAKNLRGLTVLFVDVQRLTAETAPDTDD